MPDQPGKTMSGVVCAGYEKNDYAAVFRSDSALTPPATRLFEILCDRLPAAARILDLGSGTGLPYDRYLANKGYLLTGVDFSQKHVRLARCNVPTATYLQADFTTVSFPAASFHAIISLYAIFHVPRVQHAGLFATLDGWLRPGGLIMVTLGASSYEYGADPNWLGAPMAWSSYAPDYYERILRGLGYTIEVSEYEGKLGDEEHHFWLLGQKRHMTAGACRARART